jgi:ribosomal protein S18 acetylase RimI-like enzyme
LPRIYIITGEDENGSYGIATGCRLRANGRTLMRDACVLRAATPRDVEAIAEIWHSGWRDGHLGHVPEAIHRHRRPVDFRRRVPPRIPQTTVAAIGPRVAGFVMLRGDELEQIYVEAGARGGGTASALLAHAERAIGERFALAWLAVAAGNARARRFYERNGWRDAGAIAYAAEIDGGTMAVPCRRYEKPLARPHAGAPAAGGSPQARLLEG